MKNLIFGFPALLIWVFACFRLGLLFKSSDTLLSLSLNSTIDLILLSLLIVLSSLFFSIFNIFAFKWGFVITMATVSAFVVFMFIPPPVGFVLMIFVMVSLVFNFLMIQNQLDSYLNFHPTTLFTPITKNLTKFLILSISFSYFLSTNIQIKTSGFQIPDSLIDSALKFVPQSEQLNKEVDFNQISLSQEQIQALKSNPKLMQQFGIDQKLLDSLSQNTKTTESPFKQIVKKQFQDAIKPYLMFVPMVLGVMLFFTIDFFSSLLSVIITPIIWLIFHFLEKSGFISFEIEVRQVKKMVV